MDVLEVHAAVMAAVKQVCGPDDRLGLGVEQIDRHHAWVKRIATSFGLDVADVHRVMSGMADDGQQLIVQQAMAGDPIRAVGDSMVSVAVSAFLIGLFAGAGVLPGDEVGEPLELEDIYEPDERIPAGGYIDNAGGLVRVLGLDAQGRVAAEYDGQVFPAHTRHGVECFLQHHTRVDDVPILGGEQ